MTIGYPLLKIVSSWYITRQEFKYPIWNRDGVQIERRLHHLITAYIRNFAVNPEWAAMKLAAFVPVWLLSGWRFWDTFCPWRVRKVPAFCKFCNDKGWFTRGRGNQIECDCQRVRVADPVPTCRCMVCLDSGHVGPTIEQPQPGLEIMRPCPHCERRRLIAEANSDENFWGGCTCLKLDCDCRPNPNP